MLARKTTARQRVLFAILGALAFAIAVGALKLPPLSHHMLLHIAIAGPVAGLLVAALINTWPGLPARFAHGSTLAAATVAQLAILWALHGPPTVATMAQHPGLHVAFQAVLLIGACLFWLAVTGQRPEARWRSVLALLLTGKVLCLLGVLLIFSPRLLYPGTAHGHDVSGLGDQQLAGLLMIVGCPLTYVVAAIVVVVGWLKEISRTTTLRDAGTP